MGKFRLAASTGFPSSTQRSSARAEPEPVAATTVAAEAATTVAAKSNS